MVLSSRAQEMYALIREYHESGLTQSNFCSSKHLAESTFHYWLQRYRATKARAHQPRISGPKEQSHFLPLENIPPASQGHIDCSYLHCEIERPNGTLIRIKCRKITADLLNLLHTLSA